MYQLTSGPCVLRLADRANIPVDEGNADYQDYLAWVALGNEALPIATRTEQEMAEEKKVLLSQAVAKRDILLHHLTWFYIKAKEVNDTVVVDAITAARLSLENFFNDPRIVDSVDGAVREAIFTVYYEVFAALKAASLPTYNALKALDPL